MNIEKDAWVAKPPADGLLTPALATQLQTLVKLYERIQTYIYRLMATDSVPKFCKTDRVRATICGPNSADDSSQT